MACYQLIVVKQLNVGGMDACSQGLPNQMSWNRIAIGFDGNQAFPTHDHTIIETIILRCLCKLAKMGLLLGEHGHRELACRITDPLGVDVGEPLSTLLGQIRIVMKASSRDEV